MIAYIKGKVSFIEPDSVILDNHGVGYCIKTTSDVCRSVAAGHEITLYTYLYVREDIMQLYGFMTREDLNTFRILLGINGIGPKVALAVLSAMSVQELYYAVLSEDVKAIAKTPGIGPKGAKRMIIELKDKLHPEYFDDEELQSAGDSQTTSSMSEAQDAIDALVALGYGAAESYKAVHAIDNLEHKKSDVLLKEALSHLL